MASSLIFPYMEISLDWIEPSKVKQTIAINYYDASIVNKLKGNDDSVKVQASFCLPVLPNR